MKWNRRKISKINKRLVSVENYCNKSIFKNKDISNNSFYSYEYDAVKKLRDEIVRANNNFRAKLRI